jgi:hypothetical protein
MSTARGHARPPAANKRKCFFQKKKKQAEISTIAATATSTVLVTKLPLLAGTIGCQQAAAARTGM